MGERGRDERGAVMEGSDLQVKAQEPAQANFHARTL
jgi:hypothetical protein